jgi:hypothetical protein
MNLFNSDRIQELFLVLGDKLSVLPKKWLQIMLIALLTLVPFYYLARFGFVQLMSRSYKAPQIVYSEVTKTPIEILEKKIFTFPDNSYSGYVKVKNLNLEWGVADQSYTAEFKTLGGTTLTKVEGRTFILPSSEKLIVFSRFTSQMAPDTISFTLAPTHFVRKPEVDVSYELERINVQNMSEGTTVTAGIKNQMAFTVKQVNLPVVVYNNKNEVIGVNFTYINDILSGETRTFQYTWPVELSGAVRAEIHPEINIFDRNVFGTEPGTSPIER